MHEEEMCQGEALFFCADALSVAMCLKNNLIHRQN